MQLAAPVSTQGSSFPFRRANLALGRATVMDE